jgi:alcohol dehydrogenase class IV
VFNKLRQNQSDVFIFLGGGSVIDSPKGIEAFIVKKNLKNKIT